MSETDNQTDPSELAALQAALPMTGEERERMLSLDLWVSLGEAARLDGVSARTVRRRMSADLYRSRETILESGQTGGQIHVGSLVRKGALAQHFREHGLRVGQSGEPQPSDRWALASESEKGRALERREAVAAVKRLRERRPSNLVGDLSILAQRVTYKGSLGVGLGTLYKWEKLFDEAGLDGLLPRYPKQRASRALTPEMEAYICAVRLAKPRLNCRQVYAALTHQFGAKSEREGVSLPSYKTVLREYRNVPLAALAASEGPKTLDRFLSFTERDWSGIAPNGVVFLDSRTMDTEIRVYRNRSWRIVRPRVVFMFDAGCRMWLAMEACVDAVDADAVCRAFQMAVDRWGRPVELYRDRGKDYQSQRFNAAVAKVGIPPECVHSAQAYNAKAKALIETSFNMFRQRLEPVLAGHTGSSAKERPESLRAQERNGELLTLEEYREALLAVMVKFNEEHEHTGLKGLTPREARDGWCQRGFRPVWVEESVLRSITEREDFATIRNSMVRLKGERYWNELLALHHAERVKVVWNPESLASIKVVLPSGDIVTATHYARTVHGQDDESHKEREHRKKRERRVIREYRELVTKEAGGVAPVDAGIRSTIEPENPHAVLAHSREREQHIRQRETVEACKADAHTDEPTRGRPRVTVLDEQRRGLGRAFLALQKEHEDDWALTGDQATASA